MKTQRIAVASTDGLMVDEHFGRAGHFWIFDLADSEMILKEKRKTEPLSAGDPNHRFDPEKFGRVSSVLKDCAKVYVARIGDVPAARLKELGILPEAYTGPIAGIVDMP